MAARRICRGGAALFDRALLFRLHDAERVRRKDARVADRRNAGGDGRCGSAGALSRRGRVEDGQHEGRSRLRTRPRHAVYGRSAPLQRAQLCERAVI